MTKSKGKKWEKFTLFKQGHKLPPIGGNMQGFLRTPWNATSRTTAQDALWQHISNRNTSCQPFMTPCARPVMNRIPGSLTPPWAGWWGLPYSCSMSTAIYLPAQRNWQTARQTPQIETPTAPQKSKPRREKGGPLTCSPYKQSGLWRFIRVLPAWTSVQPTDRISHCSCLGVPLGGRLAVWLSGNALASINVVALRQTRLVLGWVTVCGRVNHFGM